uniref:Uncharacterized protein n=1 Tax=Arundo donax TaxID=35708 RepID=A0A0A8YC03_ARUDO
MHLTIRSYVLYASMVRQKKHLTFSTQIQCYFWLKKVKYPVVVFMVWPEHFLITQHQDLALQVCHMTGNKSFTDRSALSFPPYFLCALPMKGGNGLISELHQASNACSYLPFA